MCSEHYKNIKEIWGDVIGYEHLYRVSTLNQIKSLRFGKEKILKPSKYDKYGHLGVSLWKNKEPKFFRVHQLVMETFIGPCPIGMEICHNDGNPANNNLDNLRYDTPKTIIMIKSNMGHFYMGRNVLGQKLIINRLWKLKHWPKKVD